MKRAVVFGTFAVMMMLAPPAAGQGVVPMPGNPVLVPLPPPPPPPKIKVPAVPQFDAPPPAAAPAPPPPSFGDRVTQCLRDAAAAGLGPADRAAYSRACASQPR